MHLVVELDGAVFRVDPEKQLAVAEIEVRVARDRLAFELELDDGHGLLHPRHRGGVADAPTHTWEAFGGVVVVSGTHEFFERGQRNAVAHFELEEPLVPQTHAQDVGDAGFLPEARAHPRNVVVAPGNGDVGLAHDVVDHLVDPRTTVAEVARDDEFGEKQVADDTRQRTQEGKFLVVVHVIVEHGVDVFAGAFEVRAKEQLAEKRFLVGRENALDGFEAVRARDAAQEFDLQAGLAAQELAARRGVGQAFREKRVSLPRVIDHIEQIKLLAGGETFAEGLLDQRAQAARGVVDDVGQLAEFSVHVADDVHRSLG